MPQYSLGQNLIQVKFIYVFPLCCIIYQDVILCINSNCICELYVCYITVSKKIVLRINCNHTQNLLQPCYYVQAVSRAACITCSVYHMQRVSRAACITCTVYHVQHYHAHLHIVHVASRAASLWRLHARLSVGCDVVLTSPVNPCLCT